MTLSLDDRQHDILQEMGIVLFERKRSAPPSRVSISRASPDARGLLANAQTQSSSSPSLQKRDFHPNPVNPNSNLNDKLNGNPDLQRKSVEQEQDRSRRAPRAPTQSHSPLSTLPELEGLGWSALMDACHGCQACALGQNAKARLFGVNPMASTSKEPWPLASTQEHRNSEPQPSRVLIVADSPQLDVNGQPIAFSALSTPLFDQLMRAASWRTQPALSSKASLKDPVPASPPAIMITHMVKCANPEISVDPQHYLTCLGYLHAQIKLLKPHVLLIMGRMAAQALVHNTEWQGLPHGKLCGRELSFDGTPMVITQSPEYLWRTGQDKAKAWHDLCLTLSLLE